jgi:uncharacterized protein YcbK (DUF882 family)|tara:strand:- start:436 stop:843 length:408 start_codon:yes stop_codon:yes gene_type:complete
MSKPSKHLSWSELACKDGTPYPLALRATRLRDLVGAFEAIRAGCGGLPIGVNSAYRTPSHNRKIGGARKSQHLQGRALDLRPPNGWTVARFHTYIRDHVPAVRGLGRYRSFVHIDVRPGRRWMPTQTQGGTKDTP